MVYSSSNQKPMFRLLLLIFFTVQVVHWTACGWFLIGEIEGFGTSSWVPSASLGSCTNRRLQYLHAFYWGFSTITGVGNPLFLVVLDLLCDVR